MRVGITLPQFRHEAGPLLAMARQAQAASLDGVFVFDHLWPLGQPGRPALDPLPLLGALAAETSTMTIGTLVARIGLLPDAVLVNALVSAARMAGGRFVAGIGAGDRLSRDENLAAGVTFGSAADRIDAVRSCASALRDNQVRVWVGGRSAWVRRTAAEIADGWNAWGATAQSIGRDSAELRPLREGFEVTWGGQVLVASSESELGVKLSRHGTRPGLVEGTPAVLARHFRELRAAGVTWAVCAPLDGGSDPGAVDLIAEAASAVR